MKTNNIQKLFLLISILTLFTGCAAPKYSRYNVVDSWEESRTVDGDLQYKYKVINDFENKNSKNRTIKLQLLSKGSTLNQTIKAQRYKDGTVLYFHYRDGNSACCWIRDKSKAGGWKTQTKTSSEYWKPVTNAVIELSDNSSGISLQNQLKTNSKGEFEITVLAIGARVFNHNPSRKNGIIANSYLAGRLNPEEYSYRINIKAQKSGKRYSINGKYFDLASSAKKVALKAYSDEIKKITIIPINIDSRVRVNNSSITISGSTLTARTILKPYFTDSNFLNIAANAFPSYVNGVASDSGIGTFNVYPGKYKLTIKNPQYYFTEKTINIKNSNKISILMSELGTKHRVKIVEQ